jgi:transposase
MARPTKLTHDVIEDICNWLKLGYYQEDAATMAGISASTFYDWMKKGDEGQKALESGTSSSLPAIQEDGEVEIVDMYSEFSEAVKKARAEAEGAHLRNIRRAADNGTWQASAWWLERSFPKKWGKRSTLDLSNGEEEIQFQIEYGD